MKRIITLLLVVIFSLATVGCSNKEDTEKATTPTKAEQSVEKSSSSYLVTELSESIAEYYATKLIIKDFNAINSRRYDDAEISNTRLHVGSYKWTDSSKMSFEISGKFYTYDKYDNYLHTYTFSGFVSAIDGDIGSYNVSYSS